MHFEYFEWIAYILHYIQKAYRTIQWLHWLCCVECFFLLYHYRKNDFIYTIFCSFPFKITLTGDWTIYLIYMNTMRGVYIHTLMICPAGFFSNLEIEFNLKRSSLGRTWIYEYAPPPLISVLVPPMTTMIWEYVRIV